MALQQQSVEVRGSQSQVVTVGRDLIMAETYVQHKPDFYKPNLDQFEPPAFVTPRNIQQLVSIVQNQRVLVLGGSPEIDKAAIARHIAWYLGQLLEQESDTADGAVPVLEWYRSSADQDLTSRFQETKERTIFVLPQIAPQDVNYDLFAVQKAAVGGQHFVLISTDVPFASWKQDASARTLFWHDLVPEVLYNADDLANVLIQKLISAEATLPPGFLPEDLQPGKPLMGKLSTRAAAETLRTPSNIAVFVQMLCAERQVLSEARVRELIELAQDYRRTLQQWYHTVLEPREQLLALGLSLFDGFFDDQSFAALEAVVEDVWRRRDISLRALDYCDLDNLRNFFSFVEAQDQAIRIESRFPDQRRTLFEIAWNSHRRQVLTALSVLTRLVRDSVSGRSLNSELYGTYTRRKQLRTVIGETLSDIGLISTRAAQDALLTLAADSETAVQAVAASALARWRAYGHDEDLFETLHAWQYETSIINAINAILRGREEEEGREKSEGAQAYIRATMALTLGYAARYDPPNQLSAALCKLLQRIASDRSKLVRDRLSSHTLPMIVPLHVKQLQGILHNMVRYVDLISAIGASLGRAYRKTPREVLRILGSWYDEAKSTRGQTAGLGITHQDALLATVAMTYGYIDYEEGIGPLTADEAFGHLETMLDGERSPFVRTAVIRAIGLQAKGHFEKVEPLLYRFVHLVTEGERTEIVKILTDMYLEQRASLEDGDETIEVRGCSYPVWINQERPMTPVEQAVFRWIKNPSNPIAQQIATQASVAFARALEQEEGREVNAMRSERKRAAEASKREREKALQPLVHGLRRGGIFVEQLIPWLVTLNAAQYRSVIPGLLPEVVAQAKRDRDATSFVLNKWGLIQADETLKAIASRLRLGLKLSDRIGLLIAVAVIALASMMCGGCCLLSRISELLK
jgi:hypothetical protein